MQTEFILYDVADNIATITLNRPEAANAQNALRIAPHEGKPVYAIPTDEERMIARHTRGIIST